MKQEYNSVVKGGPIRSLVDSMHDKLTRIALSVHDRKHPESYKGCCHSHTADKMRTLMENLQDGDKLVLLGTDDIVAHSVLANEAGEIIADSVFGQKNIEVELDLEKNFYRVDMRAGDGQLIHMNVNCAVSMADFKEHYLAPVKERMYKPAAPEAENI